MSRFSTAAAGAFAAGFCMLAIAAPALAKSEKVIGGHAPSGVDADFRLPALRGITVTPLGPAQVGNGAMSMPMVGGTVSAPDDGRHDERRGRPAVQEWKQGRPDPQLRHHPQGRRRRDHGDRQRTSDRDRDDAPGEGPHVRGEGHDERRAAYLGRVGEDDQRSGRHACGSRGRDDRPADMSIKMA